MSASADLCFPSKCYDLRHLRPLAQERKLQESKEYTLDPQLRFPFPTLFLQTDPGATLLSAMLRASTRVSEPDFFTRQSAAHLGERQVASGQNHRITALTPQDTRRIAEELMWRQRAGVDGAPRTGIGATFPTVCRVNAAFGSMYSCSGEATPS